MGDSAAGISIGYTTLNRLAYVDLVHQIVPRSMFRELFDESERVALNAGPRSHAAPRWLSEAIWRETRAEPSVGGAT